jgi:hypothetical protein
MHASRTCCSAAARASACPASSATQQAAAPGPSSSSRQHSAAVTAQLDASVALLAPGARATSQAVAASGGSTWRRQPSQQPCGGSVSRQPCVGGTCKGHRQHVRSTKPLPSAMTATSATYSTTHLQPQRQGRQQLVAGAAGGPPGCCCPLCCCHVAHQLPGIIQGGHLGGRRPGGQQGSRQLRPQVAGEGVGRQHCAAEGRTRGKSGGP